MATVNQVLNKVDDLIMDIEILIDSDYGKTDIATFKKTYTEISDKFMKEIQQLLKVKTQR